MNNSNTFFSKSSISSWTKSIGLIGLEKVLRLIFGFYLNLLIANHLGLIDFGIYSAILALITFCLTTSFIGFDNRLLADQEISDNSNKFFSYCYLRYIIFAVVTIITFYFTKLKIEDYYPHIFVLLILSGFANSEQLSVVRKDYSFFLKNRLIIYTFLIVPMRVLALYYEASISFFLWIAIVDLLLPSIIYVATLFTSKIGSKMFFDKSVLRDNFSSIYEIFYINYKYFFVGLLAITSFRLDYLVGINFVDQELVGLYAYAMIFVTPLTSMGRPLTFMIRSKLSKKGMSINNAVLFLFFIPMFLLSIICSVFFIFRNEIQDLLPLWEPSMLIFLFLIPLAWFALYSSQEFSAKGNIKHLAIKSFLSMTVGLAFYLMAQNYFGYFYFGIGVAIYYCIQGILYDVIFQRSAYS